MGPWLRCRKSADFIIGTNVGQRELAGRKLLRAITLEAQCPSLAGGLQVRSDNRYPATANGLTNAGGTATEVHSLAETQKLGSTEFPRRTVGGPGEVLGAPASPRVPAGSCGPRVTSGRRRDFAGRFLPFGRERMWAGLAHSQQNGKTLGRPVTAALFSKFEIAIRLPVGRTSVRRILAAYSPRNTSPHSSTQACRKLTKLRYDGR